MKRIVNTKLARGAALLAAALTLGAADGATAAVAGAAVSHSAGPAHTATVTARSSRYGTVLFDSRGGALYLFGRDRGGRSSCSGACAKAWPPFL